MGIFARMACTVLLTGVCLSVASPHAAGQQPKNIERQWRPRQGNPLEKPVLKTPANGTSTFYAFPNFWWTEHAAQFADPGAPVTYEIQIARDAAFTSVVDEDSVGLPRYVHDHPLVPGIYYWRVRSVTHQGEASDWSSVWSLTIVPPDEVVTVAFDRNQKDHFASVRDAVNRARSLAGCGRSVRLVFPAGDFHFPKTFSGPLIDLPGVRNVSVEGKEANLHFTTRKQALIQSLGSANVSVSGFQVSYAKGSLRIQGRVKAVDPKNRRLTLAIEPGYPDFSASDNPTNDIFILLDPKSDGRLKDRASTFYRMTKDTTRNPDGTWTVTIGQGGDFSDWEAGDRFVFHFRSGSPVLINFGNSRSVTAYDLNIGGWGNMGFTSVGGAEFSILNCRTFLPEGQWMMGNADGVHIRGHEIGPWIEGTEIQAIGDDAIALYARPASMVSAKPDGQPNVAICRDEFFNLEPGDEVSFFDPLQGTIPLETVVEAAEKQPDGTHLVRFAAPLPDGIRLDGPLVDVTQIWNRSKSCGDFVIRHCKFTHIRRYGTVFRAKRGIVENNKYRGASSRAIHFRNEPNYPNGLYASEIIVRGNKIKDSSFDGNGTAAPISFRFEARNTSAKSIGPRNLLIENNTIADCPSPEIELVNAGNVVIRNNQKLISPDQSAPARFSAIRSKNVRDSETIN